MPVNSIFYTARETIESNFEKVGMRLRSENGLQSRAETVLIPDALRPIPARPLQMRLTPTPDEA